jgi:hypothetical protein
MVKQLTLTDIVLDKAKSVEQLKENPGLVLEIKDFFVKLMLDGIKREGAFFPAYHIRLMQEAVAERFTLGNYLGKNFFFHNNPKLKELLRFKGAAPIRFNKIRNLVSYHPDHTEDTPMVISDKLTGNLTLYYKDQRSLGRYLVRVFDKNVQPNGRQHLSIKPEYLKVLREGPEERYA